MRRSAFTITLGAVLLIAAVAGFVILPQHAPTTLFVDSFTGAPCTPGAGCTTVHTGWPQTLYDALRIATWALLIVGALIVIVGLINHARRRVDLEQAR